MQVVATAPTLLVYIRHVQHGLMVVFINIEIRFVNCK